MSSFILDVRGPLAKGDMVHLGVGREVGGVVTVAGSSEIPALRAGDLLMQEKSGFRVLTANWLPAAFDVASSPVYLLECLGDIPSGEGEYSLTRKGYSLAWITLSDKGAVGKRTDESGPLIAKMVAESLELSHVQGFIIPDESDQLRALLVDLALKQGFDLVMTTGGTGVGPRDITPEATLAVIEKRLPGYERAMTAASLGKTPYGAISRAVAGTLGKAVVINMPGSPKAVAECLEPVLPTLKHTLEKLQGDPSDCAILRK